MPMDTFYQSIAGHNAINLAGIWDMIMASYYYHSLTEIKGRYVIKSRVFCGMQLLTLTTEMSDGIAVAQVWMRNNIL